MVGVHYHLNPKPHFLLLEGGRGTANIITFNLIKIRHHFGVLIILAIFDILRAAKDLFWPEAQLFCIDGWEGVPKNYSQKKRSEIQEY